MEVSKIKIEKCDKLEIIHNDEEMKLVADVVIYNNGKFYNARLDCDLNDYKFDIGEEISANVTDKNDKSKSKDDKSDNPFQKEIDGIKQAREEIEREIAIIQSKLDLSDVEGTEL